MLFFLLKSSACLAILMLFYKFYLEKTSAHTFKRFYLIIAILISIGIPFITFTEYILVEPESIILTEALINQATFEATEFTEQKNYLPIIFWSIYVIGALLFSFRFFKNLFKIIHKIKTNPKFKNEKFINVLLHDLIHPHTFFNYIFLNKNKYENNLIPNEVLLHEQVHAKQKHALDILFIEMLQIVFWFNPLLHFIKKDIKLNHEFLADQAVINNGTSTKQYQELLLAFSSNASHNQLVNAINYSLIKKRFTVMKTKTSKTKIWARSLALLPLLAILIFSFSSYKKVEKYVTSETSDINHTARSIEIEVLQNGTYRIDGIWANKETFVSTINQLHQDITPEIRNQIINIHINNNKVVSNKEVWFIYNALQDYGFYRIVTANQEINREKGNAPLAINSLISRQQKATVKQVTEYNKLAKHCNSQLESEFPIIKVKDVKRIEYLYGIMSEDQKKNAESYPDFSKVPPPPPPATGLIEINGETLFCVYFSPKRFYNSKGYLVDKNGKTINGNVQVNASDVIPGQYISKVYNNNRVVVVFKDNQPKREKGIIDISNKKLQKKLNKSNEKAEYYPDLSLLPPPSPKPPNVKKGEPSNIPPPPSQDKETVRDAKIKEHLYLYISEKRKQLDEQLKSSKTEKEKAGFLKQKKFIDERLKLLEKDLEKGEPIDIPLPPEPKAPLDYVIDMAKKGATFYYNSKKVSSDKAIKILKKDKNVHIQNIEPQSSQPIVLISQRKVEIKNKAGLEKPTAKNIVNHIKVMNKHGAKFYLGNIQITYEEALKHVRENKNSNVRTSTESNIVIIED